MRLLSFFLAFMLVSSIGYAAPRYTLVNGSGEEQGTASNPISVILTGGSIPSTSTGLAFYNTADQTTNYERVLGSWSGNVFGIYTQNGGTGTSRAIRIGQTSNYTQHQTGAFPYTGWVVPNTGSAGTVSSISGGTFTNSSGTMVYFGITPTYNQTSTAGAIDLYINRTETAIGSGQHDFINMAISGSSKARIDRTGHIFVDATNTAGGTTGNQTINKPSGTVNFAAAATAITVTNSTASTSSIILASTRTNDATCTVKNVVPGSGSFVINMTAACTAETSVGFVVIN
jgi:hypothetical protein